MVGIVIVSHSSKVAEGIQEMTGQMAKAGQKIIAAGGTACGGIGTDPIRIADAIKHADEGDGVAIFVDLGSAVLSSETALEFLDASLRERVKIVDAPILEGAFSAAVQASLGGTLEQVSATAEEARNFRKK